LSKPSDATPLPRRHAVYFCSGTYRVSTPARFSRLKALRAWASLDGNFWWGGITVGNGIRNLDTQQTSSRIGATVSLQYGKHKSIKIACSDGAYIGVGGNYQNVSVAWGYSWFGKPR